MRRPYLLTDNGSEFQGAFADYAKAQGWHYCHTYPRGPKIYAHSTSTCRATLIASMGRYYTEESVTSPPKCSPNNRYNGQRPHQGINYRTPCQMLAQHMPRLSHMWWRSTRVQKA